METRPKLQLELSFLDKLLEFLGVLTLLCLWSILLFNYFDLPNNIPTHYNASGDVDAYGSKLSILILPILGLLSYIGLTILNRYPHLFNYPIKITTDNAKRQYLIATRAIRYLKFVLLLMFLIIFNTTVDISIGISNDLGSWFVPLTVVLSFIPLIYFVVKAFKN